MNEIIPFVDIERMAMAIAKSGLFGVKTPEQACALMLIAQAEGMHPAIAARDYHVIQGRPALKADAMLARYQQAGGKVEWIEYTDNRVSARFSHPLGGSVEVTWTIEQAKLANLAGRDIWKQYPRAMLRARVVSEGVRTTFPGVAVGIYTPEETECFVNSHEYQPANAQSHPVRAAPGASGEGISAPAAPPAPPAAPSAPASAEEISEVADLSAEAGVTSARLAAWIFASTKGRTSVPNELTENEVKRLIHKLREKMASKPSPRVIEGEIIPEGYRGVESIDHP